MRAWLYQWAYFYLRHITNEYINKIFVYLTQSCKILGSDDTKPSEGKETGIY